MLNINFIPFPTLTTERLVLRQLMPEDAGDIFNLRANESVSKYISREPNIKIEEAEAFIEKITKNLHNNESGYWAISLKNNPALVGTICLFHIEKEDRRAEVGYELIPEAQGKGYVGEALQALIKYAFDVIHLHSLEARLDPLNRRSAKVLETAHFVKEAHLKESVYYHGKFADTAIYSLINSKY